MTPPSKSRAAPKDKAGGTDPNSDNNLALPEHQTEFVGNEAALRLVAGAIRNNEFATGWLLTGGEGIGKATLAFRIARALLSGVSPDDGMEFNPELPKARQADALIKSGGHPDLFVARPLFNEKTGKFATEISVETVRKLINFLNHTASMSTTRVAIIDTADLLNRNAANALLKVLEEPPGNAVVLLLSASPGRLLPTIRSRCQRIDLRPVPKADIIELLQRHGVPKQKALAIADVARGRPGHALSLAAGDGVAAVDLVQRLLSDPAMENANGVASKLSARGADSLWGLFAPILIQNLTDRARQSVEANHDKHAISSAIEVREAITDLFGRGDQLNLDRTQLVLSAARLLSRT